MTTRDTGQPEKADDSLSSRGWLLARIALYMAVEAVAAPVRRLRGRQREEGLPSLGQAARVFWDLVSRPPRLFLASLAYPRVEKVLARNDLDPALAAELAPGQRIHVLDAGNPWHRRAAALFPRSIGMRESCDEVMERLLGRTHILEGKRDFIVMKPKDHQAYTLQNLNPDESYGHTLLHEIVHCSKANKALPHPAHKEGHADCRPIDALALRAEDPERLRARFHRSVAAHRPKGGDAVHDTILYIDAVSHGLPPPDGETLEQAARIAQVLINCAELQGATDAKIVSDSPVADLVNRRIQLYFKAKAEIIEEAVAAATSQPRTETGSGSKPGRKSSV